MIAVDTNILVYAHRADAEWPAPAAEALSPFEHAGSRSTSCTHYDDFGAGRHPSAWWRSDTVTVTLSACERSLRRAATAPVIVALSGHA